jgi:transposase
MPKLFDGTGMGAVKTSISTALPTSKPPRHKPGGPHLLAEVRVQNEQLAQERDHWRKRYFLRHEEAQKLEGKLALRDALIAELELKLEKKNAHIDKLVKKLFEATSERNPLDAEDPSASDAPQTSDKPSSPTPNPERTPLKKPRGKAPGAPGYGPRDHESVPLGDERTYDIDESCCGNCGDQWQEVCEEQSDTVEVEVRAYRRRHRRKKYGHFCKHKNRWVTKRAKGPNRLFLHSRYGISFWVFLLNGKFSLHVPVNRLCTLLKQKGLSVSQGTIAAGFKRILRLIAPLIAEIKRYSREEKSHWHIDDTGWKTFVKLAGKVGFKWYLWVFRSDDVCLYIASPSRARAVPTSHLKDSVGVVNCDRLQSNRKLGEFLSYAFCWVHERRHFRELHTSYPRLRGICNEFLDLISSLFHHNKNRLLFEHGCAEQQKSQTALSETLSRILNRAQEYLGNPKIHPELRRVLKGLKADWDGLYTFFELDSIPPDNNLAEQALRGPVVGRNGYYGSGSEWSAELAASMFSLSTTLSLNNITLETFLTEYLEACAANGGNPPPKAARFLPWHRKPPPPD